eukprot:1186205-Prorocentrum_minimum.AAC.3
MGAPVYDTMGAPLRPPHPGSVGGTRVSRVIGVCEARARGARAHVGDSHPLIPRRAEAIGRSD